MNNGTKKQDNYVEGFGDKPHVLVIDDDVRICELVVRYLTEHGFVVLSAVNADEARRLLARFEFDVLVVDVMMPGETGVVFTEGLRGQGDDVPVLLLTALGEAEDRISGLEAGADDYLVKPFEPRELVLRLNAILKRTVPVKEERREFAFGEWRFDDKNAALWQGGDSVTLTSMEVTLMSALCSRIGEVLSREELAELCGLDAGERTIDVQVTRLRRKIEDDTRAPKYLHTVRGKGYVLRGDAL